MVGRIAIGPEQHMRTFSAIVVSVLPDNLTFRCDLADARFRTVGYQRIAVGQALRT
jgi:hypothetical protein